MFSLNDKHIIVNYHYIEDPNGYNSGMHPCSVSEFEKHIKFLSEHYKPASIEKTFEAAKSNSKERYYSITFDDGLKSQFENAVPILKQYGAHGTFFQIGMVREGKIPTTHKIHILLSNASSDEIIDFTEQFLKEAFPENKTAYKIPRTKRISSDRRLYEDTPTANLKETFVLLSSDVLEKLVDACLEKYNVDTEKYFNFLFMNENEIQSLEERELTVGNHTYNHFTANTFSVKKLRNDILKSQILLKDILKSLPKIFSYPHGIITKDAVDVVGHLGFTHAVTVEMRGILETDKPLLIPRYDMTSIRDFLVKKEM